MDDHIKTLFCNTRWRIFGRCDSVQYCFKHFDVILEYSMLTADLNCIECCTMVMQSGHRFCWDWGLN